MIVKKSRTSIRVNYIYQQFSTRAELFYVNREQNLPSSDLKQVLYRSLVTIIIMTEKIFRSIVVINMDAAKNRCIVCYNKNSIIYILQLLYFICFQFTCWIAKKLNIILCFFIPVCLVCLAPLEMMKCK